MGEERELEDGRERPSARARTDALRAELPAPPPASPTPGVLLPPASPAVPATEAEKVGLFRSLFRGRTDVFATRWESSRTGKSGYAPACANAWRPGVCPKPRVRCADCGVRVLLPLTDQILLEHLQGKLVAGVYPLVDGDRCWFVAADFDGDAWQDDVGAFAAASRAAGLPVSVERSRSGRGAHAWLFFSEPVAASTARRMASVLLTEAMARRPSIGMTSYDRLFPNQDALPRGGFGNLIALPLQREARAHGNTVFLDAALVPHPDQWRYLASVSRIAPEAVALVAREAGRSRSSGGPSPGR